VSARPAGRAKRRTVFGAGLLAVALCGFGAYAFNFAPISQASATPNPTRLK